MRSRQRSTELDWEISFLFLQLRRALILDADKRLTARGASMSTYTVLFALARGRRPASQLELAADVGVDPGALSRLLGALQRRRWIRISVDSRDRRKRLVSITALGRRAERELAPLVGDSMARLRSALSIRDRRALRALLTKSARSLGVGE